jgi:hypothetical protein
VVPSKARQQQGDDECECAQHHQVGIVGHQPLQGTSGHDLGLAKPQTNGFSSVLRRTILIWSFVARRAGKMVHELDRTVEDAGGDAKSCGSSGLRKLRRMRRLSVSVQKKEYALCRMYAVCHLRSHFGHSALDQEPDDVSIYSLT